MRVLVVDDDPVLRKMLDVSLQEGGHTVVQASDGRAAWELLRTDPIRLVITDWMMPEMEGPELIQRIRTTPSPSYTYIILLTVKGGKDETVAGLETGADDYLAKPFDRRELRARVAVGERIVDLEARLHASRDQLEVLAMRDSLTGLFNRHAIQTHAEAEWSRGEREGKPVSLALLDIDHFKQVNDQQGHQIGDQALRLVAEVLSQRVRPYDWVGRWGGEEFLLVLPRADLAAARLVAERVRARVAATPLRLPDQTMLPLQASLGVSSTSSGSPPTLATLLLQADQALYQAKGAGRDRVIVYEQAGFTRGTTPEVPLA